MPAGLTFDATTGTISGTPTVKNPATIYTITAYNAGGSSTATVSIEVDSLKTGSVNPRTLAITTDLNNNSVLSDPIVRQVVSPNGDGINDVLMIDGIESYSNNKVTLIDRSGKPVFEVTGYDNVNKVFDGHSNINHLMQQPGTYFYLLEYQNTKGELKRKTGYFILKY